MRSLGLSNWSGVPLVHQFGLIYSAEVTTAPATAPPAFLGLAGHPVRWRLLAELAQSDRLVDELVDRVGHPQPLVSYHLGRLRTGDLVSSRRSSKDGRAVYYRARLGRCASGLAAAGRSLHPGLASRPAELSVDAAAAPVRVLFVCTGNSARSQVAEALLQHAAGDAVHVASAGSTPKPVHPFAVEVLAGRGIDISTWRSKPLADVAGQRFDLVITLCDKVRERCPAFEGGGERVHWSIEDPSTTVDGHAVTIDRFERLAAELDERIEWLRWSINNNRNNEYEES
jgi:protein-tyrosine-phosphatase